MGLSGFQPRIIKPVAYSLHLLSYPGSSMLNVQFISRATDGGWNPLTPNRAQCPTFVNTTKGGQFLVHRGYHNLQPPAITQAVGLRNLTANTGILSPVSPYRTCGGKSEAVKYFSPGPRFPLFPVIPPFLRTHSFIYHQSNIILAIYNVIKQILKLNDHLQISLRHAVRSYLKQCC